MRPRATWWPVSIALILAVLYLCFPPHTGDLAAQTARAELFNRSGFVPYWTGWYSGLSTASYSLVTPPLLGWIGPVPLGALAIVGTAAVAVPLLRDARRPTAGAVFLVVAATFDILSGRTTFGVGAAVAVAAVLAAERRRVGLAGVLAALATATSPVAGVFLLVAAATLLLTDRDRRSAAAAQVSGVLGVLIVLAVLSRGDGGGYEPLTRTTLLISAGTAMVVVVSPVGRRVTVGAALVVLMLIGLFFVHSPIGANGARIAVLASAPTVVAASRSSRRWLVVGALLASWLPLSQAHSDLERSRVHDTSSSFVAPLLAELRTVPGEANHRVEVVDTVTHWPMTYLLPGVWLARGWERQTDESRNPQFYRGALTSSSYRAFLDRNAVSQVAVPQTAPVDYGGIREAALIATGLPYLHQVWSNSDWRLYAVTKPTSIVPAPASVVARSDTGVTIDAASAGSYVLRLHWSPYLTVDGGTVAKAENDDTKVTVQTSGVHRLHAVWRLP